MKNVPPDLPAPVPDESYWSGYLGAMFHTGDNAVDAVLGMPGTPDVAIDIETPSTTDSFTIKCVTAAWEHDGRVHTVLLDPLRSDKHRRATQRLTAAAGLLILHGSPFDIPGLVVAGLMTLDDIEKVMDTLVMARLAWPDTLERKGLEALAERVLGMSDLKGALKMAKKASGLTSNEKWYREGDIHIPVYRNGAMADTVVTLRLAHPLFEAAVNRQLDHPFGRYGHSERSGAAELVMRSQRVNRITLRRAARGLEVDLKYLDNYVEQVEVQREQANKVITEAGLRPGVGLDVIKYLDTAGELPRNWPRTAPSASRPEGTLKADKAAMALLPDHPLAAAHLAIAHTGKVLGYMEKVAARSRISGRLHPQFHILGASATGRVSTSEPELQQFPEEARPIILGDPEWKGVSSVDWSAIEPSLLGWMSGDIEFMTPFENGADIYEPIQRAAGLPMTKDGRKVAKVVVLAGMYGQGQRKLAAALGMSLDQAAELQRQMRSAMPRASRYMGRLKQLAEDHGLAITVSGRILTVASFNGQIASYKAINQQFQGSCADLVYETILAADDAGISDYLLLTMHDEVVCASDVVDEIQRIMSTPPPELVNWCNGRQPKIRTDQEFLGPSWKAC